MVVSEGNVSQVNVRHSGSADGIIEASYQIVEEFPKVWTCRIAARFL
jgi:hypothetical protein